MGVGTKLGLSILAAAFLIAVAGDYLLRGVPWGLNIAVFLTAILACVLYPILRRTVAPPGRRHIFVFAVFAFALVVCVVVRASPVLITLDILAALAALVLLAAAWRWDSGPRGVSDVLVRGIAAGVSSLVGPSFILFRGIDWGEVAPGGWRSQAAPFLRGALIAFPLLVVFGGLLVAADAVFENLVTGIFAFDVAEVIGHIALVLAVFWLVSGYLCVAFVFGGTPGYDLPRPRILSLGLIEICVVLISLNVLFGAFVVVQAGYLFGAEPQLAAGLSYSEYARRGFFELVAVAALVLPMLLALDWLLRREGRNLLAFRFLSGAMVVLVFVMMASAIWRMYLYYRELGLTELRLYTTAFMVWLAVVLVFFLVFVLYERRDRFAGWTLVSGFVAVLALNLINPDATIARANIERYEEGRELDAFYLTRLSEDAAPVIFASLPETGETPVIGVSFDGVHETLREEAVWQWGVEEGDWRSWNLSRVRAQKLAEEAASP